MNNLERVDWICKRCGQANYKWYEDEFSMAKIQCMELKGMDVMNTCINCLYQRKPKTRVNP